MICKALIYSVIIFALLVGVSQAEVYAPVLKWQRGGCYSSWCETGWYSSPAVADIDGDGKIEIIASAYSIFVLDGATGNLKWRVNSGTDMSNPTKPYVGRTWPGIVVADIDGDGQFEIITAHSGGYVSVYNSSGYFKPVWPQHVDISEFRGLSVADIDGDGKMEIIVTAANGSQTNTWVFGYDGAIRSGWPQLSNDTGYAWGVYNSNAAVADINGDGKAEIIVPSDVHYICAYKPTGVQVQANSMYGSKAWGGVGVAVDLAAELRGYVNCGVEHRPNFADSPATISDVNNDGIPEVVVTGNVYNCGTDPYTSLYEGVFIFNADRSRFDVNGFNWESVPMNVGAPISEDYNVIESCMPNPVVVDIDGDGNKEILYPAYDGKLHCFWLDKTEKYNWPYSVYKPGEGVLRFASEPVVVDLDNDGKAEIIFTSWTQKGSNLVGKVHILDMYGTLLHEIDLPAAGDWNGGLAAPTIADIDGDGDLELVVNTANSGVCAYHLPNTKNARILWGTGRGNFRRTGSNFSCAMDPVRISGVGFLSINGACKTAASDQTIQAQAQNFTENIDFTAGLPVTFSGGYDCQFQNNSGYTTLTGKMIINSGTVTIDKIIIK
ncbi:MAG TPA: VCBS repeat-containing protein [Dissulfurispiraceae bacterium]|nr:VCBS repeat-containing protein [Dissulfurispiraceae bacterium]